jgi:hypothetical protein
MTLATAGADGTTRAAQAARGLKHRGRPEPLGAGGAGAAAHARPSRARTDPGRKHIPQGWKRYGAAIDWTWCFSLSRPAPQRTRVHLRVRGKTAPWWLSTLYQAAIVPADYVMAMGMLRGLKRRVEAHHPPAASGRDPVDQAAYEMAAR